MRGEGPLRYPGAKSNLAPLVGHFLERHCLVGTKIIEPFGGSAAVSRYLLRHRLVETAEIWEADPALYAFWHSSLNYPKKIVDLLENADVSLREFDRCTDIINRPLEVDQIELGYAFIFLNRTSYSGIVGAGPIGGRSQSSTYTIDCRFNMDSLRSQIYGLSELKERFSIKSGDGISGIENANTSHFLYVDPPYFQNGKKFYRKFFNTFDHYRLRNSLRKTSATWLLSYDYDKKVEYLYRQWPQDQVALYHSARLSGQKSELLVSPLGFARIGASHADQSAVAL